METARRLARKARAGSVLATMNRLDSLGRLYGGTDKLEHGYFRYYERHLAHLRLRRQTVYEIGVGGYDEPSKGGSLRVWRDYFVRSTIVGIDIEPKVITWGRRVKFEQADQSSHHDLERVVKRHGPPAVVIDDGSHVGKHIWASFEFLWPLLPSGGVYAVEDLSTSYYPSFGGGDPAPHDSGIALLQTLADCVQANDPTFGMHPEWGSRSAPRFPDVAAVAIYPGIGFVEKG